MPDHRRIPLQPLPLAYFLAPDGAPLARASPLKPATKRSRSPSSLLTPAKRRILRAEGVICSPSSSTSSGSSRGRSPKLDTELNRRADTSTSLMPPSPSSRTHRDPQRDRVGASGARADTSAASCVYRTRSTTASLQGTPCGSPSSSSASSGPRRATPNPIMVPRRVPSPPNPQSIHYPGFNIHYDTHIELRSASSMRLCSLEPSDIEDELDALKENIPPRKRVKKTVSAPPEDDPVSSHEGLVASKIKLYASSNPATPFNASPTHTPQAPHHPHMRSPRPLEKPSPMFTPGRTPRLRSGAGIAERRRALEMEVDDPCSDEDDL